MIVVSVILVIVDVALQVTDRLVSPAFPGWETLIIILDVDSESSIPTWWAALILTLGAVTAALVAYASRSSDSSDHLYFWAIAAIFVLLSIDEQAMIHEHAIVPLRERFGFGGLLFFAWVVPATAAILVLVALFGRFVFRQPPDIRFLLVISAGLFLSGGLVMEMVGGWWSESHGPDNLTYDSMTSFEELLEYLGSSTFVLAMMNLLAARQSRVELNFVSSESPD